MNRKHSEPPHWIAAWEQATYRADPSAWNLLVCFGLYAHAGLTPPADVIKTVGEAFLAYATRVDLGSLDEAFGLQGSQGKEPAQKVATRRQRDSAFMIDMHRIVAADLPLEAAAQLVGSREWDAPAAVRWPDLARPLAPPTLLRKYRAWVRNAPARLLDGIEPIDPAALNATYRPEEVCTALRALPSETQKAWVLRRRRRLN